MFFDDTRIPVDHLVGEYNEGWRASITVLMNERVAIGAGGGGGGRSATGGVFGLIKLAQTRGLAKDAVVRQASPICTSARRFSATSACESARR